MFDLTRLLCNKRNILITFAPPVALNQSLVETFIEARPTELVAVPRVYEKLESFVKMTWQTK
jgi:long-subunit acyl-CoA synthetase (AMP-forming)